MLLQKAPNEKSFIKKSETRVSVFLIELITSDAMPPITTKVTKISGNLGSFLIVKRRCG